MPTVEDMAAEYLTLRTTLKEKEEAYEAEIAPLKEEFDAAANRLLEFCAEQNADTVRTASGTVMRKLYSRYWTSDWERMYEFISEHDAPFLLEKRIHNGNMLQFLEENPGLLPVGLQAERKYTIQVRKPTNR